MPEFEDEPLKESQRRPIGTCDKALAAADPLVFIEYYCKIPDKGTNRVIPFKLYDCQKELLEAFFRAQIERKKAPLHHVILKARQLGLTWLTCAFALWKSMFHSNEHIVLMSEKEDLAKEMMERIKFLYSHLPNALKEQIFKQNSEELHFGKKGRDGLMAKDARNSRIQCIPTTEGGVQSKTLTMFVMDEGASTRFARSIYFRSAIPALDTADGLSVVISTAKPLYYAAGAGKWFRDLYFDGKFGKNQCTAHFYGWSAVPSRTPEWHAKKMAELPDHIGGQEYPSKDIDAFQASGRNVFELTVLEERHNALLKDPNKCRRGILKIVEHNDEREDKENFIEDPRGNIFIWKEPDPNHTYTIGVDAASGIGRDCTCISVLDCDTYEQVAEVHGKIKPVETAHIANFLGHEFNEALIVVEVELHGTKVQDVLYEELVYSYLYIRRTLNRVTNEWENNLGWKTTRHTRPKLLDDLCHAVNVKMIKINSILCIQEMKEFEEDENGRGDHPTGGSSDNIMAMAFAFQGILYGQGTDVPAPSMTDEKAGKKYQSWAESVDYANAVVDDWKYL